MAEEFSIETKLELLGVELEALAKELQVIEDGMNALQKKYSPINPEDFEGEQK
jgi:hypothetical protein